MNDPGNLCPRCGCTLAGNQIDGLCASCLGALNLTGGTLADESSTPEPPPGVGELAPFFPHLEILSYLGRGGMGVVYRVRQRSLDRPAALKLLAPERAGDPAFAQRFAREARSLALLNHPSIVGVYDFGQAGGFYYLLMEFVDGPNLRQFLASHRPNLREALALIAPVCAALQAAHERGVVHRDVKPENLLIDGSGQIKIADFGISRMLDHHEDAPAPAGPASGGRRAFSTLPGGTPDYAAPEQLAKSASDHRADVYSLGVVLHEILTGRRPDPVHAGLQRPSGNLRVDAIVHRALQSNPGDRFPTIAEFGLSVASARRALERSAMVRRRAPAAVAVLAGLVLVALGAHLRSRHSTPPGTGDATGAGTAAKVVMIPSPDDVERARKDYQETYASLLYARRLLTLDSVPGAGQIDGLQKTIELRQARCLELKQWLDTYDHVADPGLAKREFEKNFAALTQARRTLALAEATAESTALNEQIHKLEARHAELKQALESDADGSVR